MACDSKRFNSEVCALLNCHFSNYLVSGLTVRQWKIDGVQEKWITHAARTLERVFSVSWPVRLFRTLYTHDVLPIARWLAGHLKSQDVSPVQLSH